MKNRLLKGESQLETPGVPSLQGKTDKKKITAFKNVLYSYILMFSY